MKWIKQILFFFLLSFISSLALSQCFFQKVYDTSIMGTNKNNFGTSIIETFDYGYIITGKFSSPLGGQVIKTDGCGNVQWDFEFDYTIGVDDASSVLQLQDSSYILCGDFYDSINPGIIYLFKISSNADSLWYKPINTGYNQRTINHYQTSDSGFIIGGYYNSGTVFLIKTDNVANIEWYKQYNDTPATDHYTRAFDLSKDGGYFLMGQYANQSTQSYDYFLIKTDSAGNQQWKKIYGSPTIDEEPKNGITTSDGGFILGGYSNGQAHLIKTDTAGNVEWEKFFGDTILFETVKAIRQLSDSSYIVACGQANDTNTNGYNVWLFRLGASGDSVLWERHYEYYHYTTGPGVLHTYVEDLKVTSDGGYIMTGYILNNSVPQKNDAWVLKVDSVGNICYHDSTIFNVWNPGCSQYDCNYIQAEITAPDTVYLDSAIQFFGGNSFVTQWQWDFWEGKTDSTQNPIHVYDSIGEFTVTLTVSNDSCSDTATATVVVVNWVGMEELGRDDYGLKVYPNPAGEYFYFENNFSIPAEFKLYDIFGREVISKILYSNKERIETNIVRNGIYAYCITDESGARHSGKLVIER